MSNEPESGVFDEADERTAGQDAKINHDQSIESIVVSAEERHREMEQQTRQQQGTASVPQPAADITLKGKQLVGREARLGPNPTVGLELPETQSNDEEGKEKPFFYQFGSAAEIVRGIAERVVEFSVLGLFVLIAVQVWYSNNIPILGLIAACLWAVFSAIVCNVVEYIKKHAVSSPGKHRPMSVTTQMVSIFGPALLLFYGSFFFLSHGLTRRHWVVQAPMSEAQVISPGEWRIVVPFMYYMRGVHSEQDLEVIGRATTKDGFLVGYQMTGRADLIASKSALIDFVRDNPKPSETLQGLAQEQLESRVKHAISSRPLADLLGPDGQLRLTGPFTVGVGVQEVEPLLTIDTVMLSQFRAEAREIMMEEATISGSDSTDVPLSTAPETTGLELPPSVPSTE